MTAQQQSQWLADLFEYERCAECHGDADHHTVCTGPFGLPFARCNYPMGDDDTLHPVIRACGF